MKDAFGGTFMIKVMITFFVIYICFFTVAISFAKTFRIKNEVINILESKDNVNNYNKAANDINAYLGSVGYSYSDNSEIKKNCTAPAELLTRGICINKISDEDSDKFYYVVTAYIVMEFPLFNFGYAIPISGETKLINL